jgi:peptide/nickel transport system ATP-binding protein
VEGAERDALVSDLLNKVGIDPEIYGNRYARQFSGGQCQRISIARSLAMRPKLLICDEMVSALDVSVQAQILNLLEDLKVEYGLTLLFIAHDLAVVKNVSDRVAVMYLGKICEIGPADTLYESPEHPYTKFLLGAALEADPDSPMHGEVLTGEPPSPMNPPSGCRFRTRCPNATEKCANEEPPLVELAPGHQVACHYPLSTLTRREPAA